MKHRATHSFGPLALLLTLSLASLPATATAQRGRTNTDTAVASTVALSSLLVRYRDALGDTAALAGFRTFQSPQDSLEWELWRERARSSGDFRVVVSLFDRELYVIRAADTLLVAPIAVASGTTLEYAGRKWTFRTPRGQRPVLRKVTNPVWSPPDWLYAEVAAAYGLQLARLSAQSSVRLSYGYRLTVRNGVVGVIAPDTKKFTPLPVDEHIVFNGTLFMPPHGTHNRRVPGELGRFALDMGNGYLIHGTPDESTIGLAVTHGCIRLADVDITWMYENIPVGTRVFIY
ncbi:MAG: L,D-transpeptidase [Gemmatimonadaceae bacterium]